MHIMLTQIDNILLENTEEEWEKVFDTNVKAAFMLCKKIVPHMEERNGDSIVFVSSVFAYFTFLIITCRCTL